MKSSIIEKKYHFLEDLNLSFEVNIHNSMVKVKSYKLPQEIFNTVPIYFLSTDLEENDFISRTITHRLYDPNEATRIAQSMILGIGGAILLEKLGMTVEKYHLN